MIERYKKMIALSVAMTFLTLLLISSLPLPAEQALNHDKEAKGTAEQGQNFIEKEQQISYQAAQKNVLPVLLGIAAVGALAFLLVILITKAKYDLTGAWDFHTDYTTEGFVDYDSVWTFTPYDEYDPVSGTFERNTNGMITKGKFFIINKKDVMFENSVYTEAYSGSFTSKTTMSGTFLINSAGAQGNWTATKR